MFLTNHCGEPAHGDAPLLDALGVEHGTWQGGFYPLTDAEAARNAEDAVDTSYGVFLTGYVVLYRGTKWFGPVLEAQFQADATASDAALPTRADVLAELEAYAEEMREPVAALGGYLVITTDACPGDRHTLQILLPAHGVCRWCPDPDTLAALIVALAGGPANRLPALAAVDGDHGDYFVIDLLTDDGGGHVGSVACWQSAGCPDPAAIAHSAQLKAAGPMYAVCCSLLRAYLSAYGVIHGNQPPANDPELENALKSLALARSGLDRRPAPGRDA